MHSPFRKGIKYYLPKDTTLFRQEIYAKSVLVIPHRKEIYSNIPFRDCRASKNEIKNFLI